MIVSLLLLSVSATATSPADNTDERALTTWLAETAALSPGAEVVTSADVTQLMELQGQKQVAGCDAADSGMDACVAELAQALGAELVVRSELGVLDGDKSLNVTVLNSTSLSSTKRALWQGKTTSALGERLRASLPALIAGARGDGDKVRVFVVDVVRTDVGAQPAPLGDDEEEPGVLAPVGGVVLGAGALGLGVAVVAELVVAGINADLDAGGGEQLSQLAAKDAIDARGGWALAGQVAWIAGGVAVVAGGALLGVGLMGGE